MANRAYLVANDRADPNGDHAADRILAASNNIIPAWWYTPFAKEDACTRAVPGRAQGIPGLIVARETGIERAEARRKVLFECLPPKLGRFYDEWLQLLRGSTAPFLQLDPCELDLTADDLRRELGAAIDALDAGGFERVATLFEETQAIQFDLATREVRLDGDFPGHVSTDLRGYGWERPVPWRDDEDVDDDEPSPDAPGPGGGSPPENAQATGDRGGARRSASPARVQQARFKGLFAALLAASTAGGLVGIVAGALTNNAIVVVLAAAAAALVAGIVVHRAVVSASLDAP